MKVAIATVATLVGEAPMGVLAATGVAPLETQLAIGVEGWRLLADFAPDILLADRWGAASPEVQGAAAEAILIVVDLTPADRGTSGLRRIGARAVVGTNASAAEIAAVVRAVAFDVGEWPSAPAVRTDSSVWPRSVGLAEPPLTRRQREIALLIEAGRSNKQIARELSIELSTVKNHVHRILERLDVENRDQVRVDN